MEWIATYAKLISDLFEDTESDTNSASDNQSKPVESGDKSG